MSDSTPTAAPPIALAMLRELANLLDKLPEYRFDYGTWAGKDWAGDPELSCGTIACAAGWATTLSSFRARGLRLARVSAWGSDPVPILMDGSLMEWGDPPTGVSALAGALEIPFTDATFLFVPLRNHPDLPIGQHWWSPDAAASPQRVALHIRRYLAWRFPDA